MCASGGVGQYHINAFAHVLTKNGISTLERLDGFSERIMSCNTSRYQKLARTFFQDRINDNQNGPVKAFAAEVLTATAVLAH